MWMCAEICGKNGRLGRSKEDGSAMKQAESNPLQRELARSQVAGSHPEFDMLTAFAEGRLLRAERQEVFAHLASCADCRELLSIASGARDQSEAGSKPYLVARPMRPPSRTWLPWLSVAASILVVCSVGLLYKQRLDTKNHATVASKNAAESNSAGTQHSIVPQQSSTHPGAAAQTSSAFAAAGSEGATTGGSARPHWRINDMGQVERSLGNGLWEAILPLEKSKMRVVSVFNADVWVGGERSRLFHSADSGTTWKILTLPEKGGSEHVIAHVRFQTSLLGTVQAADGTSWATADGGATWN
jgi:hypothetical protein